MMLWILGASVAAVGMALAVQPLVNARMGFEAGHPVYGAMASTAVSTVLFVVIALLMRLPPPDLRGLQQAPWWGWTGGVIGAGVVLSALLAAPRLGAVTTVVLFIAGQLVFSMLVDHFGWFGVPVRPVDPVRLTGVALLAVGVVLVRWR
ncbi:DMT family transporter [Marinimicrococcus flavescens]|uniref:DMT family transporter n=1 Tax=Marinimicrococcus flavescens TaxID=3031815 RepID=A0AAP3UYT5_9PROT|nr:DMT family transporter [Marinimicrococcus flavescens]